MNATELRKRVVAEFEKHGIECVDKPCNASATNYVHALGREGRHILIQDVNRHNGTSENCTVKMNCYEYSAIWSATSGSLKCIGDVIKIPKNASDKVIANRVAKAIEILRGE